jgi:hypothetical protein
MKITQREAHPGHARGAAPSAVVFESAIREPHARG